MKISEKAWKDLLSSIQFLRDHVAESPADLKIERMATTLRQETSKLLGPVFTKINNNTTHVGALNAKVNLIIALLLTAIGAVAYKIFH